jgi:SGNH domain (fused to AT3 domains)
VKRSTIRSLLGGLLLAVLAAAAVAVAQPGPGSPCYGAASRDAEHPCFNRALLTVVRPRPIAALLETDAPCDPFDRAPTISVCWFGIPASAAPPAVAIIGDSHATHWRPAVNVVARAKGWRGASVARTSCPFTLGTSASLSPALKRSCVRHNRAIPGWLAARPSIQTVFVAGNAGARVLAAGGGSQFASTVAGDVAALKSLPLTVKHVIVIRDAIKSTYQTPSCVRRALRRHQAAGLVCSVPIARVLRPDPLVIAARRIGTRVQVIDLKRFQCSAKRCFPVVGGVLVHQDIDHLTREFATTLGPYLLRAYDRLAARWPRARAASTPACFGAAARDPEHPCVNPALRRSVTPTPDQALLELDSPCAPEGPKGVLGLCGFGVPADRAAETVALLGDSHATHWRPALDVAAQARGWHVENMTRTSCPFSTAPIDKARSLRQDCQRRNREAAAWLRAHPQVRTVFVAGNAAVRVYRARPRDRFRRELAGYKAAFATLPASVQHVIVIRDSVKSTTGTNDCVRRALRAHRRAGVVCAQPRALLRRDDAAVAAARALGAPRGTVIDLTSFQCSARYCFPVVGGVLVHKDIDHITRLFATTLGPYLLRAYDRLALG